MFEISFIFQWKKFFKNVESLFLNSSNFQNKKKQSVALKKNKKKIINFKNELIIFVVILFLLFVVRLFGSFSSFFRFDLSLQLQTGWSFLSDPRVRCWIFFSFKNFIGFIALKSDFLFAPSIFQRFFGLQSLNVFPGSGVSCLATKLNKKNQNVKRK